MEKILDLVIIGAGPAGISASIYAKRAMLDFVFLEKWLPGGEIANTYEVENYPGIYNVSGLELSNHMIDHAASLGVTITLEGVDQVDLSGDIKKIVTPKNTYYAKTVIVATGAAPRKLGAIGEEKYIGRGVSFCATCDGALYKNKVVAVVGGGDVAVEDAIYLSRMVKKVYLVHRRHELRAVKTLQEKMFTIPNVEVVWDSVVDEIKGDDYVSSIHTVNKVTKEELSIDVSGVFIAVGMDPNSEFLKGQIVMDDGGWIITNEDCETSLKGVFAAGDVRKKTLRQVVTGVADGAIAVFAAEKYI
ncbi:MAG: thioredoxin-disulfide reductase [Candidatus Izemoplasmatales bacterium]|nr:thioredoxin-disulfide reductase [Candidatus Izemoplasmatales bacterium]